MCLQNKLEVESECKIIDDNCFHMNGKVCV
jgi:hypothetical protein